MAEAKNYVFGHRELAEILVKQQGIHEGLWGVYVEFGFAATNVSDPNTAEKTFTPAAISLIQKIGIQQFPEPSNLTVNAAEVNPAKSKRQNKRLR